MSTATNGKSIFGQLQNWQQGCSTLARMSPVMPLFWWCRSYRQSCVLLTPQPTFLCRV